MSPARVKRWIVLATVLSLATAAVAFLGVAELTGEPPAGRLVVATAAQARSPRGADLPAQGWTEPVAPRASRSSTGGEPAQPAAAPAAAPRRGTARPRPAPQRRRRALPVRAGEPVEVLQASSLMATIAREEDLEARLARVDRWIERLPREQAVTVIRGLLDSYLPGTFYEAETLRLVLLDRVADYPGPEAADVLIARLDPERPRPVRILAIEKLAARGGVDRSVELERIAARDHDLVVQRKARWALQRRR